MKLVRQIVVALSMAALLLLTGCPDSKEEKVEEAPKLNKTQEDIAHAPKRAVDRAKRATDKSEAATRKRQEQALEVGED